MDTALDFTSLQESVQAALISTTRTAGQISSEDIEFQRSLDPSVAAALDKQSTRLLALSNALLRSATSLSNVRAPKLTQLDDMDNDWRGVVDVVDTLLEKSDICLDEYNGVRKYRKSDQITTPKPKDARSLGSSFRTQNIIKPQVAFEIKSDNSKSAEPWKPILTSKPHAVVPLDDSLKVEINEDGQEQYEHPYNAEIHQHEWPGSLYEDHEPIRYTPVESSSAVFVDTFEGVLEMLEELKEATEIAVDLEHHDTRSYTGLLSLMQISTRQKDWIIDTLKPWRHRLEVLNEVFANPAILKVFHGAFMDIVWLQRDLGLYVVGLFDTHHASRVLGYAGGSLAFLLKKFVNFDADKKYQLADWRIRPLPEEMMFYARSDTHYLLYIYDCMRNELREKSRKDETPPTAAIDEVMERSKQVSLLRYERPWYDAEHGGGAGGWYQLLTKWPVAMTNEQFAVFRAVHAWRDEVARSDDESPFFVMSNKAVINLAKVIPQDLMALYGLCQPTSQSVKSRAEDLLKLISSSAAAGKDGPSMMSVLRPDSTGAVAQQSLSKNASHQQPAVVLDEESLLSKVSTFWGSTFGSSRWNASQPEHSDESLCLAIPYALPVHNGSDASSRDAGAVGQEKVLDTPQISTTTLTNSNRIGGDETFTLKPGGVSRKRVLASDGDSLELPDTSKKHAKQASAEEQSSKEDILMVDVAGEKNEVFDYAKAAKILHAKDHAQPGNPNGSKHRRKKGHFDPYGSKADELRGISRVQTGKGGKSATFKR